MIEIFRFELSTRLRRPSTWLLLAGYALLAFMVTTGMILEEAQRAGDILANGPAMIAVGHVIVSMIGLLFTAIIFSEAALRDVETRMHPLFATAPITSAGYLGGRFAGALVLNLVAASIVPLTMALFLREPSIPADLLGPFRAVAFAEPFLYVVVPNIIVSGALLFSVAIWTRRTLPVFAFGVLYFFFGVVVEEVIAEGMGYGMLASILDPSGFAVLSELWEFWTIHEKNTQLLGLHPTIAWNRLTWFGIAALTLAITTMRFRLEHYALRSRKLRSEPDEESRRAERLRAPAVSPRFDFASRLRQMVSIAGRAAADLMLSRDFPLIALALVALVILMAPSMISDSFGVPSWPRAQFLAPFLGSFLIALVIGLLIAFYAGELVWRERDSQMSEIGDANPLPDWVPYLGHFLALALIVVVLQAVLVTGALALQTLSGGVPFEPLLFLKISFGLQLIDYLLLATLAMTIHVLVNQKYLGHIVVVLAYLFTVFINRLGLEQGLLSQFFEHNLLVYGSDPGWVYSDVSGFGPFLGPVLWFKLYWAGFAVLIAVAGSLFWTRGRERSFRSRFRLARRRITLPVAVTAVSGALIASVTGGWIFYNTNVLNDFRTGFERRTHAAAYERLYGQYEGLPQPVVTGTTLRVEIYPEQELVDASGTYRLRNDSDVSIEEVHLFLNPIVSTRDISFDRPSRTRLHDEDHGHRIETLSRPMQPGESIEMTFAIRFERRGFPNEDINTAVVKNGTYFDHTGGRGPNHRRWMPLIGYQTNRELSREASREEQGLPARVLAAEADDEMALDQVAGRETIDLEIIVGTSEDQIAVAPGVLRRSWTENGRRYFHYETEGPVKNAYAIFSADYEVHESKWEGVQVEVFHHPAHEVNVERTARALRESLEYFSNEFGPYPYSQLRVVEFPRYGGFAHAYPGTISYGETMGWMTRIEEDTRFDMPTAIMAHEVAHQWWGYQVVPAMVKGASTISEVLAQYSALLVVDRVHGPEMVHQFLRDKRVEYLNRRGRPQHPEVPLLDATHHSNIVYRKGPIVMMALRDYIGEDAVNTALKRFLEKHGRPGQYATSLDLYRELQAVTPPRLQYLLVDLFEENTLWSFRAISAKAAARGSSWKLEVELDAKKLRVSGLGEESEVPMRGDLVEIVVWGEGDGGEAFDEPVYRRKHPISSGTEHLTLELQNKPVRVAIDPDARLVDRNWQDNERKVTIE